MQIVGGKDERGLWTEPGERVEVASDIRDAELSVRHVLLCLGPIGHGALHVELGARAAFFAVACELQIVLCDVQVLDGGEKHRLVAEQGVVVAKDALFDGQAGIRLVGARAIERGFGGGSAIPVYDVDERHRQDHIAVELILRLDDQVRYARAGATAKDRAGRHFELVPRVNGRGGEVRQEVARGDAHLGIALVCGRVRGAVLRVPRLGVHEKLGHGLQSERGMRRESA